MTRGSGGDPAADPAGPSRGAWWALPLASSILPGLGQWIAGRRRRAIGFLAPFVAVVAWGVVVAGRGTIGLLELLVQPSTLWLVFGVNLCLALLRLASVVDLWRVAPLPGTAAGRLAAVALVLVTAAPHAIAGAYTLDGIDLLETVFADPEPVATAEELLAAGYTEEDLGPVPPVPATVPASVSPTSPPATIAVRAGVPADEAKVLLVPEADLDPVRPVVVPREVDLLDLPIEPDRLAGQRITVLLAGGDAGPGRIGLRTDVMMVATFDTGTGQAAIFGIPRALSNVPLPEWMAPSFHDVEDRYWEQEVAAMNLAEGEPPPPRPERCNCLVDRLNALYSYAHSWVRTWPDTPDPGLAALRLVVSRLIGLEIDHYVLVDFGGFVDVIDALGGVDVVVTEAMDVGFSPAKEGEDPVRVNVEPGLHHLDGRQALAYVRNRTGSSDYVRMRRQRCMLSAMAEQADPLTVLRGFSSLADAIRSSTTTDLPLGLLPELVRVVASIRPGNVATVSLGSTFHAPERTFKNMPIPDVDRIRATVSAVLRDGVEGVRGGEPECP
ncbi:MAG TPA: LCP family protein [Acidimicrobiia bacterium]|nr:LCP family protein [Acidimicrobiia bacterium]